MIEFSIVDQNKCEHPTFTVEVIAHVHYFDLKTKKWCCPEAGHDISKRFSLVEVGICNHCGKFIFNREIKP